MYFFVGQKLQMSQHFSTFGSTILKSMGYNTSLRFFFYIYSMTQNTSVITLCDLFLSLLNKVFANNLYNTEITKAVSEE